MGTITCRKMKFKFSLTYSKPLEVEVRFSRWGITFRLRVFVSGVQVLERRWLLWRERSHWERLVLQDQPPCEVALQIEKAPIYMLPGLMPLTYRVYVNQVLWLELRGY
jgi:hypothetical protein